MNVDFGQIVQYIAIGLVALLAIDKILDWLRARGKLPGNPDVWKLIDEFFNELRELIPEPITNLAREAVEGYAKVFYDRVVVGTGLEKFVSRERFVELALNALDSIVATQKALSL